MRVYFLHIQVSCSKFVSQFQSETRLTRGTCDNIGGFYASNTSYNSTSSQTTSIIASSLPAILTTEGVDRCYYHTFDCSAGYVYQGQCYTNVSRSLGCETCDNIGGLMSVNDGCYYYSSDCPYYPVPGQCHNNRYWKLLVLNLFVSLFFWVIDCLAYWLTKLFNKKSYLEWSQFGLRKWGYVFLEKLSINYLLMYKFVYWVYGRIMDLVRLPAES